MRKKKIAIILTIISTIAASAVSKNAPAQTPDETGPWSTPSTHPAGSTPTSPRTPANAASSSATTISDPNDPELANLLPVGISHKDQNTKPGDIMTTIRSYKSIIENCIVTSDDSSCSLHTEGFEKLPSGNIVVLNWTYTQNAKSLPILLITVQGHPDENTGLNLIYGGDAKAGYISNDDLVGALSAGAKMIKTDEIGCRDNCVYGIEVNKTPNLATWLNTGDGIAFRFRENGQIIEISTPINEFAKAISDMATDETRRLAPGVVGTSRPAITAADLNQAPPSLVAVIKTKSH